MRLIGLSVSFALLAALPAAGQAYLAQQCAAFGEAQYKKLDPAVERILPSEYPAPALERFEGRAGSQAVAAALTLRGRLAFRNKPALDTQFVCLLDAADKPLFFYALPVLAQRGAPTPFGRGPTAAPPPLHSALPATSAPRTAAERPPLPASALRLRGLVRDTDNGLVFEACGGAPLALEDKTSGQELTRAFRDLTLGQSRPLFVEMYGQRGQGPGAGLSALELRRAAVETAGCRERYDQREWIAVGNEPGWRMDITSRDLLMSVVGGTIARFPHGGVQRDGAILSFAGAEGVDIRVVIDEQRCVDSASGAYYAYLVEVKSEGRSYVGCAAHNPAMPAP